MQDFLGRSEDLHQFIYLISHMVRVGVVVSTNLARATVRVKFGEQSGLVTNEYAVLCHKTHKDKSYWMPDIGEHGLVLCLPSGQEEGYWLGAIYSQKDEVPVVSQDKRHVVFKDTTWAEYDRKEHIFEGYNVGKTLYLGEKVIKIRGNDHIFVHAGNGTDLNERAENDVNIHAENQANYTSVDDTLTESGTHVTTRAPKITEQAAETIDTTAGETSTHEAGSDYSVRSGTLVISAAPKISEQADETISNEAGQVISLRAGEKVIISAPRIELDGDVFVSGNLFVGKGITSAGGLSIAESGDIDTPGTITAGGTVTAPLFVGEHDR